MLTEDVSLAGLAIALVLPWVTGSVLVCVLLRRCAHSNTWLLLGHGYLVGMLAMTAAVRLLHGLGITPGFTSVALVLCALFLCGLAWLYRTPVIARQIEPRGAMQAWAAILAAALMALIAYRYTGLLQEAMLRPIMAWDAWMNWAPRAVVWFELGELVQFVNPHDWRDLSPEQVVYTLGNFDAAQYPAGVPIVMLWTMWGLGVSDHSYLSLPWFMLSIALLMMLYGHLRAAGVGPLVALVGVYLFSSLPVVNVHTVLFGYADLWLAAAFGAMVMSLYAWHATGHRQFAVLAVVSAIYCTQLKMPGLLLGGIGILAVVRELLGLRWRHELLLAGACALLVLVLLLSGAGLALPGVGSITMNLSGEALPRSGVLELGLHPAHVPLFRTFFLLDNWHLLGYAIPALLAGGLIALLCGERPGTYSLALAAGAVGIVGVFFFSGYYVEAENFVTLNRGLLYLAPGFVFLAIVKFCRV